jgi:hypothetical protein
MAKHESDPIKIADMQWANKVKMGKKIKYEVMEKGVKNCPSRWARRIGKVVAINRWHVTVDLGNYNDTILIKDLYIGETKIC